MATKSGDRIFKLLQAFIGPDQKRKDKLQKKNETKKKERKKNGKKKVEGRNPKYKRV